MTDLQVRFRYRWNPATEAVENALREKGGQVAVLLGREIQRLAKVAIQRPKTISGSNRPHPSAPGQPPRERTGRLRVSIDVGYLPATPRLSGRVIVGPRVHYGKFLEHGTYKMKPRPFMAPALARAMQFARIRAAWARVA